MIKDFYNTDCMELMKTMEDKSVDMILTDIPYNYTDDNTYTNKVARATDEFGNEYTTKRRRQKVKWQNTIINQTTFDLDKFISECLRLCKGTIAIFCGYEQLSNIFTQFKAYRKDNGGMVKQLIYHKTNPIKFNMDIAYLNDIENIVLYKSPKAVFNNNGASSVLTYATMSGLTRIHPTEKPHDLLKQLILDNTNKGDIVFDPCMGSGSTCLVALQQGRQTIGCEIDKTYFDKAVERIKDKANYQFDLLEDYQ